jgi:uncharacterized membrane protein YczE
VINVFVVGPSVSVFDRWIPEFDGAPARIGLLALSIVLFGIGGGLYIGSALGPGPRDGLMTGLTARGFVLWKVRTVIEVSVLVLGWAFGGTVGVGTVVLAFALGPVTHVALGWFHIPVRGHEAEVLGE